MQQIEFIYFDLGNVIVNFDHTQASRNLSALTGIETETIHQLVFESGLQNKYESGDISTEEMIACFADTTGFRPPVDEFCYAISDIFSLNRTIWPLITQLSSTGFPIAVLSNTCSAHWDFVLKRFSNVATIFGRNENILSFELNSMKPDKKIYYAAIEQAGVDADKIFFIDDRVENVSAAQCCGITSEVFVSTQQFTDSLARFGVKINL